jgi:hypothetical protein
VPLHALPRLVLRYIANGFLRDPVRAKDRVTDAMGGHQYG